MTYEERIDAMEYFREAVNATAHAHPNPAIVKKDILDASDESKLSEIEAAHTSVKVEQEKKQLREKRVNKLAETDYTQAGDSPLSEADKSEYAEYRTYLRDAPALRDSGQISDGSLLDYDSWKPVKASYTL